MGRIKEPVLTKTGVEWVLNPVTGTRGYSYNPLTGCKGVNGVHCPYCYAKKLAETRMRGRCGYPADNPFEPTWHEDKLTAPLKKRIPSGIFTCDMSDLFGNWVPEEYIREVLLMITKCPQHVFYLLTKNPARYREFVDIWPTNAWAGATVDKDAEWKRNTDLSLFRQDMGEQARDEAAYLSFDRTNAYPHAEPDINQPGLDHNWRDNQI